MIAGELQAKARNLSNFEDRVVGTDLGGQIFADSAPIVVQIYQFKYQR